VYVFNPERIASSSPGLRGTSYPGWKSKKISQPQRGCGQFGGRDLATTPLALMQFYGRAPRVGAVRQPWALGRNPVGIRKFAIDQWRSHRDPKFFSVQSVSTDGNFSSHMSIQTLIGVAAFCWLMLLAVCLLALRWSFTSIQRRFWVCLMFSVVTMLCSWWGLTRFHLAWSQTVNGKRQWFVDSSWFFTLTLALGALALACTLWQRRKQNQLALAKR